MQRIAIAASGLAALCLAGVGTAALGLAPFAPEKAGVGEPLPQLEVSGFSVEGIESLDDLFGQTVLLEFFAHW